MNKRILITAAILAIIAIIFGAFGAHKLKEFLTIQELSAFETGVRYQMYHAFLLLFLGLFNGVPIKIKKKVYSIILLGILLFSGSIYLLSTHVLSGVDFSTIGIVTPIGGLLLIFGWGVLLRSFMNLKEA